MEPAIQARLAGQTSPEIDAMDRRVVQASVVQFLDG